MVLTFKLYRYTTVLLVILYTIFKIDIRYPNNIV